MNYLGVMNMMMRMAEDESIWQPYLYIRFAMLIVISLLSLFLVWVVLIQPGNTAGLGALGGSSETFLGKNKGRTKEGRRKKLTVYVAILIAVLLIAYLLIELLS